MTRAPEFSSFESSALVFFRVVIMQVIRPTRLRNGEQLGI
jgi:hypothetical protein